MSIKKTQKLGATLLARLQKRQIRVFKNIKQMFDKLFFVYYNEHIKGNGRMKKYLIFGIFLILAKKGQCTAKEIAEHFEVSTRSVYRYIDALNMAGVPIVSATGRRGGFCILEGFSLDKFVSQNFENGTITA